MRNNSDKNLCFEIYNKYINLMIVGYQYVAHKREKERKNERKRMSENIFRVRMHGGRVKLNTLVLNLKPK